MKDGDASVAGEGAAMADPEAPARPSPGGASPEKSVTE